MKYVGLLNRVRALAAGLPTAGTVLRIEGGLPAGFVLPAQSTSPSESASPPESAAPEALPSPQEARTLVSGSALEPNTPAAAAKAAPRPPRGDYGKAPKSDWEQRYWQDMQQQRRRRL